MRFSFSLLLVSIAATAASAGVISLETQTQTAVKGENLEITVHVTNRGTESAYNVQLKTDGPQSTRESPVQSTLPVGESFAAAFRHPLKGLLPGRYPCVVRVLYGDANLYPFSALSLAYFVHGQDAVPEILGALGSTDLRDRDHLDLKLKNLGSESQSLHLRLLLPQEISADSAAMEATVPAAAEQRVSFAIHNFSALSGSTYPVYVLMEYDQGGRHFSTSAMGTVTVQAASTPLKSLQSLFFPLAILLVAVVFFMNVKPFRKAR